MLIAKSIFLVAVIFIYPASVAAQDSNQQLILNSFIALSEGFISVENTYSVKIEPVNSDALVQLTDLLVQSFPHVQFTRNPEVATHELIFLAEVENTLSRLNKKDYERSISGTVSLQVVELESELFVHTQRQQLNHQDVLNLHQIEYIDSPWYPARIHLESDERKYSFLRRVLEPLAVTSAVLTTVYLLYNVRSS